LEVRDVLARSVAFSSFEAEAYQKVSPSPTLSRHPGPFCLRFLRERPIKGQLGFFGSLLPFFLFRSTFTKRHLSPSVCVQLFLNREAFFLPTSLRPRKCYHLLLENLHISCVKCIWSQLSLLRVCPLSPSDRVSSPRPQYATLNLYNSLPLISGEPGLHSFTSFPPPTLVFRFLLFPFFLFRSQDNYAIGPSFLMFSGPYLPSPPIQEVLLHAIFTRPLSFSPSFMLRVACSSQRRRTPTLVLNPAMGAVNFAL